MQTPSDYKNILQKKAAEIFGAPEFSTSGLECTHIYTQAVDEAICSIFELQASRNNAHERISLVALGGYGRKELCPHSDIDLLVLHSSSTPPACIAPFVRFMWDTGLNLGCVVRSLSECKAILGQDIATDTAFIEGRHLSGDKKLTDHLLLKIVTAHIRRTAKTFSGFMHTCLFRSLHSESMSMFRIEPDLKNGVATLRDCQRMMWAEFPGHEHQSMQQCLQRALGSDTAAHDFYEGYDFLTKMRIALHWACGHKQDILESSLQSDVAKILGFGETGAGKLMERFYRVVRAVRFSLLLYLEINPVKKQMWDSVQRRIGSVHVAEGFAISSGILFQTTPSFRQYAPSTIIMLFVRALNQKAALSVSLMHSIEKCNETLSIDDYRIPAVTKSFLAIMRHENRIGPILGQLHESRTLGRIIPQFDTLFCKVEYDSYHELTVDEHTIQAVSAIDDLKNETETVMRLCYEQYGKQHIPVLRLALLFHDIGKAMQGDHSLHGVIIANEMCDVIGLPQQETNLVCFLVFNHLKLSDLSLMGDPSEATMKEMGCMIATPQTLALLYLLTVTDIRKVGRATWTGWKSFVFEQQFGRLSEAIKTLDSPATHESEPLMSVFSMASDESVFAELSAQTTSDAISIRSESFAGFDRLIICGPDRIGFLADIIGCLSSEGYNILSAHILSKNNQALDVFTVEPPKLPAITVSKRIDNLYKKWDLLKRGLATAKTLVENRLATYPIRNFRTHKKPRAPVITFVNNDNQAYTTLRIDAEDSVGLVYKIASTLSECSVNIIGAHLFTRVDKASDIFHITSSSLSPIYTKETLAQIRSALETHLEL